MVLLCSLAYVVWPPPSVCLLVGNGSWGGCLCELDDEGSGIVFGAGDSGRALARCFALAPTLALFGRSVTSGLSAGLSDLGGSYDTPPGANTLGDFPGFWA